MNVVKQPLSRPMAKTVDLLIDSPTSKTVQALDI
jgi:hypothetical protein